MPVLATFNLQLEPEELPLVCEVMGMPGTRDRGPTAMQYDGVELVGRGGRRMALADLRGRLEVRSLDESPGLDDLARIDGQLSLAALDHWLYQLGEHVLEREWYDVPTYTVETGRWER